MKQNTRPLRLCASLAPRLPRLVESENTPALAMEHVGTAHGWALKCAGRLGYRRNCPQRALCFPHCFRPFVVIAVVNVPAPAPRTVVAASLLLARPPGTIGGCLVGASNPAAASTAC